MRVVRRSQVERIVSTIDDALHKRHELRIRRDRLKEALTVANRRIKKGLASAGVYEQELTERFTTLIVMDAIRHVGGFRVSRIADSDVIVVNGVRILVCCVCDMEQYAFFRPETRVRGRRIDIEGLLIVKACFSPDVSRQWTIRFYHKGAVPCPYDNRMVRRIPAGTPLYNGGSMRWPSSKKGQRNKVSFDEDSLAVELSDLNRARRLKAFRAKRQKEALLGPDARHTHLPRNHLRKLR